MEKRQRLLQQKSRKKKLMFQKLSHKSRPLSVVFRCGRILILSVVFRCGRILILLCLGVGEFSFCLLCFGVGEFSFTFLLFSKATLSLGHFPSPSVCCGCRQQAQGVTLEHVLIPNVVCNLCQTLRWGSHRFHWIVDEREARYATALL